MLAPQERLRLALAAAGERRPSPAPRRHADQRPVEDPQTRRDHRGRGRDGRRQNRLVLALLGAQSSTHFLGSSHNRERGASRTQDDLSSCVDYYLTAEKQNKKVHEVVILFWRPNGWPWVLLPTPNSICAEFQFGNTPRTYAKVLSRKQN